MICHVHNDFSSNAKLISLETDDEWEHMFNDAINNILRGLPSNFETINQLIDQMSNIALYQLPDDYYASYPSELLKVKIKDVQRVAYEYMDQGPDLILIIGDMSQLDSKLNNLGYEIVHADSEGRPL